MLRVSGEADPQEVGKRVIGRALEVAIDRSSLTKQGLAFAMGYTDPGVIGRWISGLETPQFAKLWTLPHATAEERVSFRQQLVVALAEQAEGVDIVTEVRITRKVG